TIIVTNGNTRGLRIGDHRGGVLIFEDNEIFTDRSPVSFQIREEDQLGNYDWIGCSEKYTLTEYPGFDQHWHYNNGSNKVNGGPFMDEFSDYSMLYELDPVFLVEGLNFFVGEGTYEPFPRLTYPHPLRGSPE